MNPTRYFLSGFALVLIAACGSSESDAPAHATTIGGSCAALAACCASPGFPAAARPACQSTVVSGNDEVCAEASSGYQGAGACGAVGGGASGQGGAAAGFGGAADGTKGVGPGQAGQAGGEAGVGGAPSAGGTSGEAGASGAGGQHEGGGGTDASCGANEAVCPKGCADLESDTANCGSCGYACPSAGAGTKATCVKGACALECPASGAKLCQGEGTPYCAQLATDVDDCGACGHACDPAPQGATVLCGGGHCKTQCPGGGSYCNGACVDLANDLENCGACDVSCEEKAQAAGLNSDPDNETFTLACTQGACIATVKGSAGINCANGCEGKTCDSLCQAAYGVSCDPNNPPVGCSELTSGACATYYQMFGDGETIMCDKPYACGQTMPGADDCGTGYFVDLVGMECECAGERKL